jgi:hypothetical protein
MAVNRQQNLFAAEDWKIAYKAYSEIDFQAYDFDTIRGALVDYVKTNYPENFNDYIESSEFIAIIEMLAYLSQSLAFRMDVNTRENFLETAESRESVYKLARMLGYNPKRNIPASGLMKVVSVKTSEALIDSQGNDLSNQTVYWDDANNPQAYEQFITIMNAAMSKTNRFSSPLKDGTVGGVKTELYQLNTPQAAPIVYNIDINVGGAAKPFTIVNPDFKDGSHIFERHPDPTNLFNMIYRNDGKGLSSGDTGFFVHFRQGRMDFEDFNYTTPLENRVQEVAIPNIGENDIYLQEINSGGVPLSKWERIPNTVGQTLNYNSKSLDTRNLYAVESSGTTGVRLRFTDGNFGNIPVGIYRMWYRVSDPTRFVIQPQDAKNKTITIPYENAQGKAHAITLRFSLVNAVNNSLPAESITAIKERAPQVYYTQDRMVSAQDYNVFPQSQVSNITKIKATNKTHAGHSRYIDINDPTGTYQNLDTFTNDAYLYTEMKNDVENIVINNNTTSLDVATVHMPNRLKELPMKNFIYYHAKNVWTNPELGGSINNFLFTADDNIRWNPLPIDAQSNTGFMTEDFSTGEKNILVTNVAKTKHLKQNTFLKWVNPLDRTEYKWVKINEVRDGGQLTAGITTSLGPWTLSDEVPRDWLLTETFVSLRSVFNQIEANLVTDLIDSRSTFALGYDLLLDSWYSIPASQLSQTVKTGHYKLDVNNRGASSWLILMEYSPIDQNSYRYTMTTRGQDYVVQSRKELKFYNVKNVKVLDKTNRSAQDTITFTTANTKPTDSELFAWRGGQWENTVVGTYHIPRAIHVDLPLRTRDTKWYDVEAKWISNFGLFSPLVGDTPELITSNNRYVNDAIISVPTYEQAGATTTELSNIVIASGKGVIQSLPKRLRFPFTATTFGENPVKTIGGQSFITYRQIPKNGSYGAEQIFVGNVGQPAYSYGTDGAAIAVPNVEGRLELESYDTVTQTGVLVYKDLQDNDLHSSKDRTGITSMDKLDILYTSNKSYITEPIHWYISDVYREADGYTDPRKVKVAPLDTDGDLVPDKPRQFADFVGLRDLILFEYYTDLDGYTYDRPVSGRILDYRREDDVIINNSENFSSPVSYRKNTPLTGTDWVLVKNKTVADKFAVSNASGIVIYVEDTQQIYQVVPESTAINTAFTLQYTTDYAVKHGRGYSQDILDPDPSGGYIRWQHVAPKDVRIDPSISNIVEMIVLTTSYNDEVTSWKATKTGEFPLEPTSNELAREMSSLNTYKSASDTLVYRSAKFKLLFGEQAATEHRARFRVVKLSDQLSDNELKTRIVSAINDYFNVDNWEFGETFYFTELSTYIHQTLGSAIGSIVILPKSTNSKLGELFQVKADPNELFISTASVNDIEIISRLDNQTLRTDR